MQALVLTLHILACIILIILVLLQSGKEGMGVIFGGGSSTLFGSSGAGGFLTKVTAILATVFLATSLGYNIVISKKKAGTSEISNVQMEDVQTPEQPQGVSIEEPEETEDQGSGAANSGETSDAAGQPTSDEEAATTPDQGTEQ